MGIAAVLFAAMEPGLVRMGPSLFLAGVDHAGWSDRLPVLGTDAAAEAAHPATLWVRSDILMMPRRPNRSVSCVEAPPVP